MARFEKFFKTATKKGTKVLGSIHPELKAASTKDKFVLNPVAQKLMGIKAGVDRVMLFDKVGDATSQNDRFFICKGGVDAHGTIHGSLLGKNGVFSYSEIWSAFHMNDMAVVAARPDDMVAKGIVIQTTEAQAKDDNGNLKFDKKTGKPVMVGGSYIANQLVLGKLEIVSEDEEELRGVEVEDGLFADIYMVTNLRFEAHTPQLGSDDEEGEVEETDEDAEAGEEGEAKPSRRRKA